jgi:hypothetical protein
MKLDHCGPKSRREITPSLDRHDGVAMEIFRQRCQNEHQAQAGKCRVSIGRNVLLVPPLVESTLYAYSMQPAYTLLSHYIVTDVYELFPSVGGISIHNLKMEDISYPSNVQYSSQFAPF